MSTRTHLIALSGGHMQRERGISTLTVTLIIVLLTGLAMIYASRNAINEQRLAANEQRDRQAAAAAQAGLDIALAYMEGGGIDRNNDNVVDAVPAASVTVGSSRAVFCAQNANLDNLVCPATPATLSCGVGFTPPSSEFTRVVAFACGWSDDNAAVHKMTQLFAAGQSLGGGLQTPLISKGTTNLLTGGGSVLNHDNDLTVWTGDSILGQSNTGKTFISDKTGTPPADLRNEANSPACNNPPTGYTCSTQGDNIGHDTITGDTRLSSLDTDGFFATFFGKPMAEYKSSVSTSNVFDGSNLNQSQLTSVASSGNAVIWVDGNLDGNTLPNPVGSQEKPVILIVNGNMTLSSNTVINGIVFIAGNISGNGTPKVFGSMIVNGTSAFNGNLLIVYDGVVAKKAETIGKVSKVPGSWRDW